MFNSKFKKALVIMLVLVMSITTVVVAANNIYTKQLTATYGRIKFEVDGKDVTQEIENKYDTPAFVVGERSYVPVRAIADLMGLEIEYDNSTHTAKIIDTKSDAYEAKITKLEKELEDLKKDVVEETDIEALEKKLNKEFGIYEDVYFDIVLKETRNNISVTVEIDFSNSTDRNNWNRMTTSIKRGLVEDITDMIAKEFPNLDITGSVYDTYYENDLMTFSQRKNGRISVSFRRSSSGTGIDYLDELVADVFYDEYIDDAEVDDFNVSSSTVSMVISFSNYYRDEWEDLRTNDIEDMLDIIADEINYDYPDKYVDIEIYRGNKSQGRYTRSYNSNYGTFR